MEKKSFEAMVEVDEIGNVKISSGLPKSEPLLTWPLERKRGVMTPCVNGDLSFVANGPCGVLPPRVDEVYREGGVTVKRTTRNYIIMMKVPVIESAEETTRKHSSMWKKVAAVIKKNREEIKEMM